MCVFKTIDNFFIAFSHIWPDKYLALTVFKHGSRIVAVKSEKKIHYNRMTVERLAAKSYVYINPIIGTFSRGAR